MAADIGMTLLMPDPARAADAQAICRRLRDSAPYCRVRAHAIDPVAEFSEDTAHRTGAVAAALQSDVVLYLASGIDRTSAALIALRERAGFTWRLAEPEFARVWFSPNGERSLYVLGELPGAFGALALALELGCGDFAAAQRVRAGDPPLIAV